MNHSTVVLRNLEPEDAPRIAAWGSDECFRRAAGWSDADYSARLAHFRDLAAPAVSGVRRFAVDASGTLVGLVEFSPLPGSTALELGFSVGPSSNWGRGYGAGTVAAAVAYAEHELKARELVANVHEANVRSRRVLERNGFLLAGMGEMDTFEDHPSALLHYERAAERPDSRFRVSA